MPPHRKNQIRRTATLSGSFYDKSGAIGDGLPSPTATSFRDREYGMGMGRIGAAAGEDTGADSDDEYCLTGYGEMSTDYLFTLPPSPTQTIKYRYRAYRPKLAKLGKKYRTAADGRTPLKTKSSAYHPSDFILGAYLSGMSGRSTKGDFRALMQRYRDSAEGWRDGESSVTPARKAQMIKTLSSANNAGRL